MFQACRCYPNLGLDLSQLQFFSLKISICFYRNWLHVLYLALKLLCQCSLQNYSKAKIPKTPKTWTIYQTLNSWSQMLWKEKERKKRRQTFNLSEIGRKKGVTGKRINSQPKSNNAFSLLHLEIQRNVGIKMKKGDKDQMNPDKKSNRINSKRQIYFKPNISKQNFNFQRSIR